MSALSKCLESIGYRRLTDFQKTSFDVIYRKGFSAILVAPTGSGKTEAAVLPVMYDISVKKLKPISAIYVTPLRALNRDIEDRISRLAQCFGIKVALRHGDTPSNIRRFIAKDPPHILITTPESFAYILINDSLRMFITNLKYVIFDEFRELVDSKRGYLLFLLTYFLEKFFLKRNIVKIALTATLRNEDYARRILSGSTIPYKTIVLRDRFEKKLDIEIHVVKSSGKVDNNGLNEKILYIIDKVLSNKGTLIFTNTRSLAEKLCFLINYGLDKQDCEDVRVSIHHGSLSLSHRVSAEKEFKKGLIKGLVATSSMELGIDIGSVDYVIQYGSPRQATRLLQRIGRSGHKLGSISRGSIVVNDNVLQVLESMVLLRRAKLLDLEVEKPYENPLDVLSYAIVVLTHILPEGVDINNLYVTLTNHPQFSYLDYEAFDKLINYLVDARLVSVEKGCVKPRRKGLIYIFRTNMIPETRDYKVVEIATKREVGVLNEEYVILELAEDDLMILAGEIWRVVSIDHKDCVVYVEKPSEVLNTPVTPHWEGENIPVEYSVAREVGSIIRRLKQGLFPREYAGFKNILEDLSSRVKEFGDDREVVITGLMEEGLVFINIYGGDRINRFLRDLLKKTLDTKYPELKVRVYSNPYLIIVFSDKLSNQLKYGVVLKEIEYTLKKLRDSSIDDVFIKKIACSSILYLWRTYQVAQRFGAVDPSAHMVTRKLLEAFSETVIGEEALNEVLRRDYDVSFLVKLIEAFRKGLIRVVVRDCSMDFIREALNYVESLSIPSIAFMSMGAFREKVLNRRVRLMCLKCGWLIEGLLSDFLNKGFSYKCGECGFSALTVVKSDEDRAIVSKFIHGDQLDPQESRRMEDLQKKSIFLNNTGDLGLIILSARGVGASDAKLILHRVRAGEDLFNILYEYEKRVVKYKKYYDS